MMGAIEHAAVTAIRHRSCKFKYERICITKSDPMTATAATPPRANPTCTSDQPHSPSPIGEKAASNEARQIVEMNSINNKTETFATVAHGTLITGLGLSKCAAMFAGSLNKNIARMS